MRGGEGGDREGVQGRRVKDLAKTMNLGGAHFFIFFIFLFGIWVGSYFIFILSSIPVRRALVLIPLTLLRSFAK